MDLSFYTWWFFRHFFLFLVALYLISGLDDLVIDLIYYVRLFFRAVFRRKVVRPVTREQLAAAPEKPIAVIIPAWDESNVISRMLLNTVNTLLYRNYRIFVGTYPNDEATKLEVEKVREIYPNIEFVVTPTDGPTNKADCLNWIYQGIRIFEKDHNLKFEMFVFHDAEDVVHPLSLTYYNYLMPRIPFIQVPVFPLEQKWWNFTTGMYMDEFAENHTKDLRVRELLGQAIPSAGVGTAVSREAMDYLARLRNNQLFDITSLTEDYMMGLSLRDMPGKKILLQQSVAHTVTVRRRWGKGVREKVVNEPIATREFFPSSFWTAVHQKSRWILGISIQGWNYGWTRSVGLNYCLFRDRKAVVTNLLTVLGYLVVLYWGLAQMVAWLAPAKAVPPLIEIDEPAFKLVYVVIGLFFWRLFNRAVAVWRIYSPLQAMLSMPRMFYGNLLNFAATWKAIDRYIKARLLKQTPAWGKTQHAYPTEDQMRAFRRRLGDLLLERRIITAEQLQAALDRQKGSTLKLGEILIGMGVLKDEDLQQMLAEQRTGTAVRS
jgi:adsorption protein B